MQRAVPKSPPGKELRDLHAAHDELGLLLRQHPEADVIALRVAHEIGSVDGNAARLRPVRKVVLAPRQYRLPQQESAQPY